MSEMASPHESVSDNEINDTESIDSPTIDVDPAQDYDIPCLACAHCKVCCCFASPLTLEDHRNRG